MTPQVTGDYYFVYISHSPNRTTPNYPNELSYDYLFTVPRNESFDESEEGNELKHTAFISNKDSKGAGMYYIGIKLISEYKLGFIFSYFTENRIF